MRHATLAACGLALFVAGCSNATAQKQPTARERQDRAMKDPFGYKPDWSNTSVSGGGTADLDKDGLKRDLDHVLNP
jgi:hypothetical protein